MILFVALVLLVATVLPVQASAPPVVVPAGFRYTELASGLLTPKGVVSALHQAGTGQFGDYLYVAESDGDRISRVDKDGGSEVFATGFDFPVGVAFYGGKFGKYLYVGNAYGGGIDRVDTDGNVSDFALSTEAIAGLDFGHDAYGPYLYAGEWAAGKIWKVDSAGNATLFATLPAGRQSRYLKFSHDDPGVDFGTYLYVTDFTTGNIYKVDPAGAVTYFTTACGTVGQEGLAFSPGGAFGDYMYAANLYTGDIWRITPAGVVTSWAHIAAGAADIHFEPGAAGGFVMYVVDGHSKVYAIQVD